MESLAEKTNVVLTLDDQGELVRAIRMIWFVLCIALLFQTLWEVSSDPQSEVGILFVYGMLFLTFPLGLAYPAIMFFLSEYVRIEMNPVIRYLFDWGFLVTLGYMQWFVLVPQLFRNLKQKNKNNIDESSR